MSLQNELREAGARYVINYDFLRHFFKRTPKKAEVAAYLIDLDAYHNAEGDYFQADKAYLARGLKCSRTTVSESLEELARHNLIDYISNYEGTYVRVHKEEYLKIFEQYTAEMNKEKEGGMSNIGQGVDQYWTGACTILDRGMSNIGQGGVAHLAQLSNKLSNELTEEVSKEVSKNKSGGEPQTTSNEVALFQSQEITKEDLTKVIDDLLMYALDKFKNVNNTTTIKAVRKDIENEYLKNGYDSAKQLIDSAERFMFI